MIASPPDPMHPHLAYETPVVDYEARRWRPFRGFAIATCVLALALIGWLMTLNQDVISDRIPDLWAFWVLVTLATSWLVGLLGNCYLFCFLRLQEPASKPLTSAIRWTTSAAVLHLAVAAYYAVASSR